MNLLKYCFESKHIVISVSLVSLLLNSQFFCYTS